MTSSRIRFSRPGDKTLKRAENVNTIGEVPDSSWFTNRIGRQSMAVADLAQGAGHRIGTC